MERENKTASPAVRRTRGWCRECLLVTTDFALGRMNHPGGRSCLPGPLHLPLSVTDPNASSLGSNAPWDTLFWWEHLALEPALFAFIHEYDQSACIVEPQRPSPLRRHRLCRFGDTRGSSHRTKPLARSNQVTEDEDCGDCSRIRHDHGMLPSWKGSLPAFVAIWPRSQTGVFTDKKCTDPSAKAKLQPVEWKL
jgi:hypothetical protein